MQKLLTLKEMAEKLNRDVRTLKKYVRAYHIPHVKLGRDLLFNEQRVISYLESMSAAYVGTAVKAPAKKSQKKSAKVPSSNPRYEQMLGLV